MTSFIFEIINRFLYLSESNLSQGGEDEQI